MPTITVLSTVDFTAAQLDKLRAVSPRLVIEQTGDTPLEELAPALRERIEILYGWGKAVSQAHRLPRLNWLQTHSAGIDYLLDTPLWRSDALISSMNGIHATPMAEHALAMMLAFRWRLPTMWRFQQQAHWPQGRWELFSRPELRGSALGIVGYGAVGRELARQAHGLKMRILAVNRSGERSLYRGYTEPGLGDPQAALPETIYPTEALPEMLPQCDYVALLAPLTPETRHLFDAQTFAQMKPGAVFLNLGRGGLVDESALLEALQTGRLGGAGLDVFEEEPLPAASPLWGLENLLISPHVSGFSPHYDDRASDLFAENLRRYLAGESLLNQVKRERGY